MNLLHIIKEGIQDTCYIWKSELNLIFKDSGVMIFFFIVPFAYPVLYGLIYNNEVVREAQLVVVDHCDTQSSREFIRRINGTPDVDVVYYANNIDEAKDRLDRKEAYGILEIPSNFSSDIHTGKRTTVSLYSDMSCLLYYKNYLIAATEASFDFGKEMVQSLHPSTTREEGKIAVNPIPYESVAMFNPANGFGSFILPAILILVIQQTLILGICMLGGTAREKNRFHTLVPISKHYHGTLRIVLGKSLAYIILYILTCCWVLIIVPALFDLPQHVDIGTLGLFILPYLFACIFFSITLSGFVISREAPMLLFVFTSVILLFISGVSWPMHSINGFWRILAYAFPSTAGVQGFVAINSMGATLNEVAFEYHVLWIQTGVYFITACLVYRYQIIRSRKLLLKGSELMKQK